MLNATSQRAKPNPRRRARKHTTNRVRGIARRLIERGMGPEDIIALHAECVSRMLPSFAPIEQARAMGDSHQFLLEVMIAYGIRFREYLELRVTETQRAAEAGGGGQ